MRRLPVMEWMRALGWRGAGAVLAALLVLGAPWWGPRLLSHLSYFQLRRVEIDGRRYVSARELVARMRVDTGMSIWTDLSAIERRVASDPQVQSVTIGRKLPGTLVVHITENLPVAFVPGRGGLHAVDADGGVLPIDPTRVSLDLPVLTAPDTGLLDLLARLRDRFPALFERISTVRRAPPDDLTFWLTPTARRGAGGRGPSADSRWPPLVVRALPGVSAHRFADILPVERDLARRNARVTELDLRYRDQVIARLQ